MGKNSNHKNENKPVKKPKGFRDIVFDGVAYWWGVPRHNLYIQRVSDRKRVDPWHYLCDKGYYHAMENWEIQWTPAFVAEIIRDVFKNI